MKKYAWLGLLVFCTVIWVTVTPSEQVQLSEQMQPPAPGSYSVSSTNLEVAAEFAGFGDDEMHSYLLGLPTENGSPRYIADILKHPADAWITEVSVPDNAVYGPARNITLPVVSFVTFPTTNERPAPFAFPYHNGAYGTFDDMLSGGEQPVFAEPDKRYPLIILSHGASAHGIYDIEHAQKLARRGFIVAVLFYADDRTTIKDQPNPHLDFLRPLLTKAVLDSLLSSDTFGPHIDSQNIGISGHSFGGFTALAMGGARVHGNPAATTDPRFSAAVIAAPWVGHDGRGDRVYAFGAENRELTNVTMPIISFYGTDDKVTTASSILPAMGKLSGPTYVIELVNQPHVFEDGSWQDRDNWEALFFSAYLQNDQHALQLLKQGKSMAGGNQDIQHFDYQKQ